MSNVSVETFHLWISNALSFDGEMRKKSENLLKQFMEGDPNEYIRISVAYLNNNNKYISVSNKCLLCTQLRNNLIESNDIHSILKALSQETINLLIQSLMMIFINQETPSNLFLQVTHCISQLGSSIMSLNIQMWPNFLEQIFEWTQSKFPRVREGALIIFSEVVGDHVDAFENHCATLAKLLNDRLNDEESEKVKLLSIKATSVLIKTTRMKKELIKLFKPLASTMISFLMKTLGNANYSTAVDIIKCMISILEVRPSFFDDILSPLFNSFIHIAHTCSSTVTASFKNTSSNSDNSNSSSFTLSQSTQQDLIDLRNISVEFLTELFESQPEKIWKMKEGQKTAGASFLSLLYEIMISFRIYSMWDDDDEEDDPDDSLDLGCDSIVRLTQALGVKKMSSLILQPAQSLIMSSEWKMRFVGYQMLSALAEGAEDNLPSSSSLIKKLLRFSFISFIGPKVIDSSFNSSGIGEGRIEIGGQSITSSSLSQSSKELSDKDILNLLINSTDVFDNSSRGVYGSLLILERICEQGKGKYINKGERGTSICAALLLLLRSQKMKNSITVQDEIVDVLSQFTANVNKKQILSLSSDLITAICLRINISLPSPSSLSQSQFNQQNSSINNEGGINKQILSELSYEHIFLQRNSFMSCLDRLISELGRSILPLKLPLGNMLLSFLEKEGEVMNESERELQSNAAHCLSSLMTAVGVNESACFVQRLTSAILKLLQYMKNKKTNNSSSSSSSSSSTGEAVSDAEENFTATWLQLASLLKGRFSPVLPFIIPPLLEEAKKKTHLYYSPISIEDIRKNISSSSSYSYSPLSSPSENSTSLSNLPPPVSGSVSLNTLPSELISHFQKGGNEENEREEWVETRVPTGYAIYLRNSFDNRSVALKNLITFGKAMGPYFSPYVSECWKIGLEGLNDYNNESSVTTSGDPAELCEVCIQCLSPLPLISEHHPLFVDEYEEVDIGGVGGKNGGKGGGSSSLISISQSQMNAMLDATKGMNEKEDSSLPPLPPLPSPPEEMHPVKMFIDLIPFIVKIIEDDQFTNNEEKSQVLNCFTNSLIHISPILSLQSRGFNPSLNSSSDPLKPSSLSQCYIYPPPFDQCFPPFGPQSSLSLSPSSPFSFDLSSFCLWIVEITGKIRVSKRDTMKKMMDGDTEDIGKEDKDDMEEAVEESDIVSDLLLIINQFWKIYKENFYPYYFRYFDTLLLHLATPSVCKDSFNLPPPLPSSGADQDKLSSSLQIHLSIPSDSEEAITATSLINKVIINSTSENKAAIANRYLPLCFFLSDILSSFVRDEPIIRINCFYNIGYTAQYCSEAFFPYMLKALEIIKREIMWYKALSSYKKKNERNNEEKEDGENELDDLKMKKKLIKQRKSQKSKNVIGNENTFEAILSSYDFSSISQEQIQYEGISYDNSVSCLLRILKYQTPLLKQSNPNADSILLQSWNAWIHCLPLTHDEEEAKFCHDELINMITSKNVIAYGFGDTSLASEVIQILSSKQNSLNQTKNTIVDPYTSKAGNVLSHLFNILIHIIETDYITLKANVEAKNILLIIRPHLPSSYLAQEWNKLDENTQNELSILFQNG